MFKHELLTSEIAQKVQCRALPEYWKFTTSDGQHSCVLVEKYLNDAERIKNLEVYEDDVWVISFPKTGTTWTQEMVWRIVHNEDLEKAESSNIMDRFPFVEYSAVIGRDFTESSVTQVENHPRPRFIKSHLPKAFLPDQLWTKKPKIIYVTRNPKDTAISFFHHYRHIEGYFGTKEDFFEAFIHDSVVWGPFIPHIMGFWKMRNEKNIFYLNYEEMNRDLRSVIKRIAEFLGKDLSSAKADELEKKLSIDSMRNDEMINMQGLVELSHELNEKFINEHKLNVDIQKDSYQFIRQGKAKAYEIEMSPEWNSKFDKWIAKSLKGTDLKFDF